MSKDAAMNQGAAMSASPVINEKTGEVFSVAAENPPVRMHDLEAYGTATAAI